MEHVHLSIDSLIETISRECRVISGFNRGVGIPGTVNGPKKRVIVDDVEFFKIFVGCYNVKELQYFAVFPTCS